MRTKGYILQSLSFNGIPIVESDISYIQQVLNTILHAKVSTKAFPNIDDEAPFVITDKDLVLYD